MISDDAEGVGSKRDPWATGLPVLKKSLPFFLDRLNADGLARLVSCIFLFTTMRAYDYTVTLPDNSLGERTGPRLNKQCNKQWIGGTWVSSFWARLETFSNPKVTGGAT